MVTVAFPSNNDDLTPDEFIRKLEIAVRLIRESYQSLREECGEDEVFVAFRYPPLSLVNRLDTDQDLGDGYVKVHVDEEPDIAPAIEIGRY